MAVARPSHPWRTARRMSVKNARNRGSDTLTCNSYTAEERALNEAATRVDAVGQHNWLSEMLARVSGDEPDATRQRSIHGSSGASQSALSNDEATPTAVRRNAVNLHDYEDLQSKLFSHIEGKRTDNLYGSWPDIATALDLVKDTAVALDHMNKRTSAIESYALKVVAQLRQELSDAVARASLYQERVLAAERNTQDLQVELSTCQQRASRSEERARRAEEELQNAKAWMAHAHDVITNSLSGVIDDWRKLDPREDIMVELESKFQGPSGANSSD